MELKKKKQIQEPDWWSLEAGGGGWVECVKAKCPVYKISPGNVTYKETMVHNTLVYLNVSITSRF